MDALCKRYRIDNSKRVQHTAIIDCELLAKVYINLIGQREPTLNFTSENDQKSALEKSNISYFKKIINPSNEEIKKHNEYLSKNLKKNFFN